MLRKELLVEALMKMGMPQEMLNDFDTHSTIMLATIPEKDVAVYISAAQEHVFIWAKLHFLNDYSAQNNIYELFDFLIQPRDFIATEQYAFGKRDSVFELKAMLKNEVLLSADNFTAALIAFCEDLDRVHQITN